MYFNGSRVTFEAKDVIADQVASAVLDERTRLPATQSRHAHDLDPFVLMEDNSQSHEEVEFARKEYDNRGLDDPLTNRFSTFNSPKSLCSYDEDVKSLICSVKLTPNGLWRKAFDPQVLRMDVTYTLDSTPIRIEARPCSCGKNVRIGSKDGPINSSMWTLEAGQSAIALYVTDDSHSKQWVYSKYYLIIHRDPRMPQPGNFSISQKYSICTLYQDCDMKLDAEHPCGLVSEGELLMTWQEAVDRLNSKRPCTNGHHRGHWTLPCQDCANKQSCFWELAKWTTDECSYSVSLNIRDLKEALKGKTLVFFGDSTLRGMMYYIIEKINTTLNEWRVVHDHVVLDNVNFHATKFIYVYYPQFWLPPEERKNSLGTLFSNFGPFQNNSNTILITGGVQWLDMGFLQELRDQLKKRDLTGIDVVVKGYGTGFNVPAAGMLFRTLEEQEKVATLNERLVEQALSYGYKVIDTFWMTSSRFKQYLHGKCACHFHHISHHPMANVYKVEGTINKAYSDILLQIL